MENSAMIKKLNDEARANYGGPSTDNYRSMMSAGVNHLIEEQDCALEIVQSVRSFSDFNGDNDPYGEHDFFIFNLKGKQLYFKIDYYDKDCEYGSDDPSDAESTCRVMMVMLPSEY